MKQKLSVTCSNPIHKQDLQPDKTLRNNTRELQLPQS